MNHKRLGLTLGVVCALLGPVVLGTGADLHEIASTLARTYRKDFDFGLSEIARMAEAQKQCREATQQLCPQPISVTPIEIWIGAVIHAVAAGLWLAGPALASIGGGWVFGRFGVTAVSTLAGGWWRWVNG